VEEFHGQFKIGGGKKEVLLDWRENEKAIAAVSSGTILTVHLQKCPHLSNEIRVMEKK
jgi:hypothetical protein